MINREKLTTRRIILSALVLLAAAGFTINWFHLNPGSCYTKGMAVGSSVCHQIPSHSFIRDDIQFPLCARCSGLYLGCFIGLVYFMFQGRKAGLPKKGFLVLMIILTAAWGGDGINSFISDFLNRPFLYGTTNITRLVTGFGMGLVLSTALMTLFNLTIWKDPQNEALLKNLRQIGGYILAAVIFGLLLVYAGKTVFQTLAYISVLTILTVISILYTIFWVIIFRRENSFENLIALTFFLIAGFTSAMIQISLMTALRGWLIG